MHVASSTSCSDLSFFTASKAKESGTPAASTSSVVVRTVSRKPTVYPRSSVSSQSSESPPRKRKAISELPKEVKRLREATPDVPKTRQRSAESSRASSSRTSPEPVYRSRSVSALPPPVKPPGSPRVFRGVQDGSPGSDFQSAEVVVTGLMRKYKGYFTNPLDPDDTSFEPHPTDSPCVELEFPNNNACERYLLLAPKDKDHYNPIFDLEKSLYIMVSEYMTPEQQALFGRVPTDILDDDTPPASPTPSPPSSIRSGMSDIALDLTAYPLRTEVNYLRAIQRSIHLHDGPLFMRTMYTINKLLRKLKYPTLPDDPWMELKGTNAMYENVKPWRQLKQGVCMRIIDETYQRCVGPNIASLKQYEAFSSEVYGELLPSFASDIILATGMNKDSLFVDLGSGVGNIAIQASLQTGCRSFGIELMPAPAEVARTQLAQVQKRCRMWGVAMGDVELVEGDMLTHPKVNELLAKADVVLVNNKVFLESLNEALRPKFLDLKEGAVVVSLKPFVQGKGRMTERNVDDISTIFDLTERPYHAGSVSWGAGGGTYFLHRVDREGYAAVRARFENSRSSSRTAGGGSSTRNSSRRWGG